MFRERFLPSLSRLLRNSRVGTQLGSEHEPSRAAVRAAVGHSDHVCSMSSSPEQKGEGDLRSRFRIHLQPRCVKDPTMTLLVKTTQPDGLLFLLAKLNLKYELWLPLRRYRYHHLVKFSSQKEAADAEKALLEARRYPVHFYKPDEKEEGAITGLRGWESKKSKTSTDRISVENVDVTEVTIFLAAFGRDIGVKVRAVVNKPNMSMIQFDDEMTATEVLNKFFDLDKKVSFLEFAKRTYAESLHARREQFKKEMKMDIPSSASRLIVECHSVKKLMDAIAERGYNLHKRSTFMRYVPKLESVYVSSLFAEVAPELKEVLAGDFEVYFTKRVAGYEWAVHETSFLKGIKLVESEEEPDHEAPD